MRVRIFSLILALTLAAIFAADVEAFGCRHRRAGRGGAGCASPTNGGCAPAMGYSGAATYNGFAQATSCAECGQIGQLQQAMPQQQVPLAAVSNSDAVFSFDQATGRWHQVGTVHGNRFTPVSQQR